MMPETTLYRHSGVALVRAAARPLGRTMQHWPDLDDTDACRAWITEAWGDAELAQAVREASPALAERITQLVAGEDRSPRQIRGAAVSLARYALRSTGRPTPFGLFAGVAPASWSPALCGQIGPKHRPVARVDTEWLASVIVRLEACPGLLERLPIVFNNLAARRGGRLNVPHGGTQIASVRYTSAVAEIHRATTRPTVFRDVVTQLVARIPGATPDKAAQVLTDMVRQGFLLTALRAPLTVTDPLGFVLHQLDQVDAAGVPDAAPILYALRDIAEALAYHNTAPLGSGLAELRDQVRARMRELSAAGRTPLAVDLQLDATVRLPATVAKEIERATGALLQLSRHPSGDAAWRDFHAVFWERYGTGTLVPLADVVDPAAGLGFPADYPGSLMASPAETATGRDERLLALAWQAVAGGAREITLTDAMITSIVGNRPVNPADAPRHVEMAARVHATSLQALKRGEFTLTVAPARSAGTLTARFTPLASGTGLEDLYRSVPVATEGAIPAQLSFPALYPHTENVCRIPAYLPHVIPLGEHRQPGTEPGAELIDVEDLAVTATGTRLYLVSISRRRVIEPQVFHAMALEKQPPPLARFLAHLARSCGPVWTGFDWGPRAFAMPFLPRVRYGRTVLSPARWLLRDSYVSGETDTAWRTSMLQWAARWKCPAVVELRDADQTLRLTLGEPTHAAILRAHLQRHGEAVLTETAPSAAEFGWLDGHVHDVAVPLVSTAAPAPGPLAESMPVVRNREIGRLPGAPGARWVHAKVFTHPDQYHEIITAAVPRLLAELGDPDWWFVRYRSPNEPFHLRLRVAVTDDAQQAACMAALGRWGEQLRADHLASRLVLDAYSPETGRYGAGQAMAAAEAVFVADSRAVAATLTAPPASAAALAAAGMVAIAEGFLGRQEGLGWLVGRPVPSVVSIDRAVPGQATRLLYSGPADDLAPLWQARAAALAAYRPHVLDTQVDAVLESLFHMHHNRVIGMDREGEAACRRLAHQLAMSTLVREGAGR